MTPVGSIYLERPRKLWTIFHKHSNLKIFEEALLSSNIICFHITELLIRLGNYKTISWTFFYTHQSFYFLCIVCGLLKKMLQLIKNQRSNTYAVYKKTEKPFNRITFNNLDHWSWSITFFLCPQCLSNQYQIYAKIERSILIYWVCWLNFFTIILCVNLREINYFLIFDLDWLEFHNRVPGLQSLL